MNAALGRLDMSGAGFHTVEDDLTALSGPTYLNALEGSLSADPVALITRRAARLHRCGLPDIDFCLRRPGFQATHFLWLIFSRDIS